MKTRLIYAFAIVLVIALGLSTRKFPAAMPEFVSLHFGDALWAAMVYFGFRALLPQKPLLLSVALSLAFSFGIEFSQLYQQEWINNLRSTTLGALVLGKGFLWIDLLRYVAGVAFAYFADLCLSSFSKSAGSKQYQ